MHINKIVEDALSEDALELLNTLAANALLSPAAEDGSLSFLPVGADDWNATMLLMREIFEAEVTIAGDGEWLSFRILQALGVNAGRLAYQFTPTFARALAT